MRVIAIAQGYGGKDKHALREPGDQFEVPDGSKASWYEPVEEEAAPAGGKKGKQQSGHDLA
ncbi:MAG: hypothetical protein J0I68_30705 [Achromobacter sp.]|uniref:hypothetical protein n=1 Tax=Achromobacter TaxID=222 RepID=UPI001ACBD91E|nr:MULTISPECIES: hypothetical protein [Achromobacter]MBN9642936.1 hypothetical protein [Achromobacter sp.]